MSWASLVAVIVVGLTVLSWVRIVPEYQRLVIYRLGHYAGFRGPGLVLVFTPVDRGVPIAMGEQGETVSEDWADFENVSVPIRLDAPAPKGTIVTVAGFEDSYFVRVRAEGDASRVLVCENCGHVNRY